MKTLYQQYVDQRPIPESKNTTITCIQEGENEVVVQIRTLINKVPLSYDTEYELGEIIDGVFVISALKKSKL